MEDTDRPSLLYPRGSLSSILRATLEEIQLVSRGEWVSSPSYTTFPLLSSVFSALEPEKEVPRARMANDLRWAGCSPIVV